MTLHVLNESSMTLNRHENIDHYVIFASLKNAKLVNRIPGLRLLISSLPGTALRTNVESLSKPRDVSKCSRSHAW